MSVVREGSRERADTTCWVSQLLCFLDVFQQGLTYSTFIGKYIILY